MKLGLFTSFAAMAVLCATSVAADRRQRRALTRPLNTGEEHGRSTKVSHQALLKLNQPKLKGQAKLRNQPRLNNKKGTKTTAETTTEETTTETSSSSKATKSSRSGGSSSSTRTFPSCDSDLSSGSGKSKSASNRSIDGENVSEDVCDPCDLDSGDEDYCEDVYDTVCDPSNDSYDSDDCDFVGLGDYSAMSNDFAAQKMLAEARGKLVQPKKKVVIKKKLKGQALLKLRNQPQLNNKKSKTRTFPSCDSDLSSGTARSGKSASNRSIDGENVSEDVCDPCDLDSGDEDYCEDVYDTVCDPSNDSYDSDDCDFVGLGDYSAMSNDFAAQKMLAEARGKLVQPKKKVVIKKKLKGQALLKLRNQPQLNNKKSSKTRTFPSCDSDLSSGTARSGKSASNRSIDGENVSEDVCDPCDLASGDEDYCEDVYDTVCDPSNDSYDSDDCDFVGLGDYSMMSNDFAFASAPRMLRGH